MLDFQVSIKPSYVTYFSVEVSVPKREGQYVGEIEMETDYEVSRDVSYPVLCINGEILQLFKQATIFN